MASRPAPELAGGGGGGGGGEGGGLVATEEIEEVEMEIEEQEEEVVRELEVEVERVKDSPKNKGLDDTEEKADSGGDHEVLKSKLVTPGLCGVTTAEKKPMLQPHNDEKLSKTVANGNGDGTFKREDFNLPCTVGSQTLADSNVLSLHTSQHRLRSSSPGGELENKNKRPARICDFFTQGWCIMGKNCKFLHHKEGSGAENGLSKEEKGGPLRAGGYGSRTGSPEASQLRKLSNLKEPQFILNSEGSSKIELQRALVRAYGGESEGLPHLLDSHNYRTSKVSQEMFSEIDDSLTKTPTNPVNELGQMPMAQEEHNEPYCAGPDLGAGEDRYLDSRGIFPRVYLDETKLQFEVAKGNSLSDSHASRTYRAVNPLNPEYRYRSFDLSISSDLLQSSNKLYAYGRTTENLPSQRQEVHYSGRDSCGSYSLTGLTTSGFDSSVHSLRSSPFRAISHLGTSSLHRFTPSFENAVHHKDLDLDKGCYTSRSGSLLGSSPHYSRSDMESINHRPLMASSGHLSPIEDKVWETSVPFRPSFCFSESKSSPGSQYDPLVDSIDPPKLERKNNQKSPMAISYSTSSQNTNENAIIGGSTTGFNAQKSLNYDSKLGRSMSAKGSNEFTTLMASDGGRKSSLHGENWATRMKAGDRNVDAVLQRDQDDKGPSDNEKAMKQFHFHLVEFVKELVKPFWKEGHLTKDAHKMVVKKSVEKVLASFEHHQVPATEESINNYMAVSESKIQKLVKAYVDKYGIL